MLVIIKDIKEFKERIIANASIVNLQLEQLFFYLELKKKMITIMFHINKT